MVTIQIDGESRTTEDRDVKRWINEQINKRRAAGLPVCVHVSIQHGPTQLNLISAECHGGGGGGTLSNVQQKIWELWLKNKMGGTDFHGGNLIAFLNQLANLLK